MLHIPSTEHRPLGAVERLFWLLDQNRPTHFAMAAEIDGHIALANLAVALQVVVSGNPLLAANIVVDDTGMPSFVTLGARPVANIAAPGSDWTGLMAAELDQRFDAAVEPLFRVTMVPGEERQTLILTAHHSIADGVSLAYLLEDLLAALAGEAVSQRSIPAALESRVVSPPSPSSPADEETSAKGPPQSYRPEGELTKVSTLLLEKSVTDDIVAATRAEGATLHGALCAALAQSFARRRASSSAAPRILSPVDARRRLLDGERGLAMYVNAVAVDVPRTDSTFWERARELSSRHAGIRTAEGVASGIHAVDRAMAGVTSVDHAAKVWASVFGAELLLSNLGKLDLRTDFGGLHLRGLWGPAVSMGLSGEQSVGVSTLHDRLHLVHVSTQPVEGLLEGLAASLMRATQGRGLS